MPRLTTFIGVDLAWSSDKNHSGIVVLRGSSKGAELVSFSEGIATLDGVVNYVTEHTSPNTVIAIDAPLIIRNKGGQRPCETLIGKKFSARDASAHTSNLNRFPDAASVHLVEILRSKGFSHETCPENDKQKRGKWLFECYPHPAQVVLFALNLIIKYKKGRVFQKRAGLQTLRGYIQDRLIPADPPLRSNELLRTLLGANIDEVSGKNLKQYEDQLDACFCAYLALFYWHWGSEKNEMLGDLTTGYIINPTESA
jgi:predicted RNase H-like nuclease